MGVYNLNAKVSIMAVYTLTMKHFRFPQLFILFSLFMITNLFSVLTPFTFTSALSFNFTSFSSQELNISYEKAYADEDQVIQLTGSTLKEGLAGRATYFRPMHLWNKASGNLKDFSTHFTFVIDSQNQTKYADGLTFFLAPNGSKRSTGTYSKNLGLYNYPPSNSQDSCFVAVEFAIWSNFQWDPPGAHVGIDINSMKSVNVPWLSNISIMEGKTNEAWISYNSSSKNLSVVFTGFKNNVTVLQSLSRIVDLRNYLPESPITYEKAKCDGLGYDFSSRSIASTNTTVFVPPANNVETENNDVKNELANENIDKDLNISYEQNAYADEHQVIQLTGNVAWQVGRATYFRPMHLWDRNSRKLTDFATHFSFVIDSQNQNYYADGMAFFLAPNGSKIPTGTKGGSLGLFDLNSTSNRFVAVEFDIMRNEWDPPEVHSLSYTVDLRIHLPEWVTFGFSAATGYNYAIHTIHSWNFSSSLEIENNNTDPNGPNPVLPSSRLIRTWKLPRKRRGNEDDDALDEEFKREVGPRRFSYDELARATNDFNSKEKLGQGGFGEVYKGFLRTLDSIVAIKRVLEGSKQGIGEYVSEVKIIGQLRHKNLVQLIGWCHEKSKGQLLLIYDFMPNGSLDSHLFREDTLLVWEVRYKIVQDLASALLYLHEEWESCVLHRDIKSSNIMLDSNFNAKLGDFGLARLVDHARGSLTTNLAGTQGYMDPRCVTTRKANKESDIYSFGIVALELACGRKPVIHEAPEDQIVMLEWVRELHGRGEVLLNAADQRLGGNFDEQQMKCLLNVGLWCAHSEYDRRPSIREAIQVLNFEAPLPLLQLDTPLSLYRTRTVNEATTLLSTSSGATNSTK
ncbi:L-type lectin-domain containing receptor kinase IX.1-like [Quercus lobata]|uniref:L-type lectin-domain containing receptor kinase IX.1-like n=1 Tax=Quercus lobata TaxID=97700 RepID=UPI00124773AE|nr:L-type lectin-domain containing receptor kinase IX.1-like [Quercus lobata]